MTESVLSDAAWLRASTIEERLAPWRDRVHSEEAGGGEVERWMARWRSQPPFTNDDLFAQRIATEGVTEGQFFRLLAKAPGKTGNRPLSIPSWLTDLSEAFSRPGSSKAVGCPATIKEQSLWAFVEPLVAHHLARLDRRLNELLEAEARPPIEPQTIESLLLADLPRQLLPMVSRTLVLELNVARLEDRLHGDTAEQRFANFLEKLRQPAFALAILREYPVLARQIMIRLDQWLAFSLEFLERLSVDWKLLQRTFSSEQHPGVLVDLRTGAGDRHCGGRSVSIATFSSGRQLVYKPKSLAAEAHFQQLITWLNQHGVVTPFRTLQVVDRGNYGWVEFARAEPCLSIAEVERFYERQGGYLALLYVLEATDFHFENVIAAGEHPLLVDLEAIFHPRTAPAAEEQFDDTIFAHSVVRVGLLPMIDWSEGDTEGVDVSGLGGAPGQISSLATPDWEMAETDEMRLTRTRMALPGAGNRPRLDGSDVGPGDYVEQIVAGFTNVYRLLLRHRKELSSSDGPLEWFANDDLRAVLRTTRTYGVLLSESFHPDVLRDALDRELLFDRLWLAVESRPYLAQAIVDERQDLQSGDIPLFTSHPGSRDVWTTSGRRIHDFFDEPSLQVVRRRLAELGEPDLDLQRWIIRASLATTVQSPNYQTGSTATVSESQQHHIDPDQLLTAAGAVGDRLASLALSSNGNASWLGLIVDDERRWSVSPLAPDLYDGLGGVALFLAYLGAVTGQPRYRHLGEQACALMLRRAETGKASVNSIGAFDGWGGTIYTLMHLGALWHQPEVIGKAAGFVELIASRIEQDEHFDIMDGAAGAIGSLIAFHRVAPSGRTLSAAIDCGDHLIKHAHRTDRGLGWTGATQRVPLSGFSHGGAGIAWALLRLAALTGEARFHATALDAIAYERTLFSSQAGNWRDLRARRTANASIVEDADFFETAWCHGAPGIGLARLSTIKQLDDHDIRREIETAVKTTASQGVGPNDSLCHGNLGNLELLVQAGQLLNDRRWVIAADAIASTVVERAARNEYRCGTPLNVESPGLMTGLAGIGYGLLRLAKPLQVPCILTLEPPLQQ